ncbi:MAG: DedD protein [Pseudohongiellaceae bacterium]|jgi:DedD protein
MSETIDGLKQRLVGAFVILSLAVIFLPMVFDNPHEVNKVTIEAVPPKPDFQHIVIEKPERPTFKVVDIDPADHKVKKEDQISSAKTIQGATKIRVVPVKASVVASEESSAIKPKVSHLPIFKNIWMVQLGTFSRVQNAYELRDRLRKDGFDGHAKDIEIKGAKAVRVLSGPFVNRKKAEKMKRELDKRYKVQSLIIYFDA